MAKMVHESGEKGLARGCQKAGIPEAVSTNASYPLREIVGSVEKGIDMNFFFQLYFDKDRSKSEKLLREVEALGVKGIFVTVDAAAPGKREADERVKAHETLATPMSGAKAKNDAKGGSLGRIMAGYIDPSLCWDDIPWLRTHTKLPIVLKGIMTWMDAKKAMELGIDGIVLSNHGGRNLDTSPLPILVLLELQRNCPEVFDRLEVFADGGIMRGTDIFKALCLGAKAMGIGRGLLFALNYGEEGVEKFISSKLPAFLMFLSDVGVLGKCLMIGCPKSHSLPEVNLPNRKWLRISSTAQKNPAKRASWRCGVSTKKNKRRPHVREANQNCWFL